MEAVTIDGNNMLAVYDTIKGVRDYCIKNQKPYLIECVTFRMRGHEEASGTKYVPKELFDEWEEKDPIKNFEAMLLKRKLFCRNRNRKISKRIKQKYRRRIKTG